MIFEVKKGSFGYEKAHILHDISFQLENGEVMSVLGPNGVGKTTLLKCMMGFLKWDSGQTCIDGIPLQQIGSKEIWKRIAYVPQAKGATFSYSAMDMVVLGRSAHIGTFGKPSKEDYKIAHQAMEEIGILHLKDKLCTKMSGGDLQMVLIARAMTVFPEMLVLDEPESNLDFKNQLIILDTIKRLAKERNISAIVNTHYPSHALQIADKSLMLNKDGTSFYGKAEDVINEANMRRAFHVNVHINEFQIEDVVYKDVVPLSLAQ